MYVMLLAPMRVRNGLQTLVDLVLAFCTALSSDCDIACISGAGPIVHQQSMISTQSSVTVASIGFQQTLPLSLVERRPEKSNGTVHPVNGEEEVGARTPRSPVRTAIKKIEANIENTEVGRQVARRNVSFSNSDMHPNLKSDSRTHNKTKPKQQELSCSPTKSLNVVVHIQGAQDELPSLSIQQAIREELEGISNCLVLRSRSIPHTFAQADLHYMSAWSKAPF